MTGDHEFTIDHEDLSVRQGIDSWYELSDQQRQAVEHSLKRQQRGYWWTLALLGAYLLLLVMVWLWWWAVASSRFGAMLESYRAAGQPIAADDFVPPPISDHENAAFYYQQAIATLSTALNDPNATLLSPDKMLYELQDRTAWQQRRLEVAHFVAAHQAALNLVTVADQRIAADWGFRFEPFNRNVSGELNETERLSWVINVAAIDALHRGEVAEALHWLSCNLRLGESVARGYPIIIGSLLGSMISDSGSDVIKNHFSIDAGPLHPEAREAALSLIDRLLKVDSVKQTHRRAIYGERLVIVMIADFVFAHGSFLNSNPIMRSASDGWIPTHVLSPPVLLSTVHAAQYTTRIAELPIGQKQSQADVELRESLADPSYSQMLIMLPVSLMLPIYDDIIKANAETLTLRHMAAVKLALRLYQADHGTLPAGLELLAPEYLPRVPRDLFDPDGGPIRYAIHSSPRLIYSCGSNRSDDGGSFRFNRSGNVARDSLDLVWSLDGPLRKPPAE